MILGLIFLSQISLLQLFFPAFVLFYDYIIGWWSEEVLLWQSVS